MAHTYRKLLAVLLGSLLAGCASAPEAPLPTVASVDLARYMGTWYEIALLPNRFQARCSALTQAHYQLEGDRVRVTNRCLDVHGKAVEANGVAYAQPDSSNAKLRVSFFRPFYGNYWILALDPDYQWVLIGEPQRKYAWILARSRQLDEPRINQLLDLAATLGFDRQAFRRSPQKLATGS